MKQKKKIVIIIGILMLLLIPCLFYSKKTSTIEKKKVYQSEEQEKFLKDYTYENGFKLTKKKQLKLCKAESDICVGNGSVFSTIEYDTDSKVLQELIEKINQETEESYQKMKASSVDQQAPSNLCERVIENYNYLYDSESYFAFYKNSHYISIRVLRNASNLCTDTNEDTYDTYLYDRKKDQLIDTKNLLEIFNITKEEIIELIKEDLSEELDKDGIIERSGIGENLDYKLSYSEQGNLVVAYQRKEENAIFWYELNIENPEEEKGENSSLPKEEKSQNLVPFLVGGFGIIVGLLVIIILIQRKKKTED